MPNTVLSSVDEYIAAQPQSTQALLRTVRAAIRKGAPQAVEAISYKIPAWQLEGRPVLYLAGWKRHFSLYPATKTTVAAFGDEVAPYFDNKSTLRFPLSEPVPEKLIERIANFRASEVAGRNNASRTSPPTRRTAPRLTKTEPRA